MDGCTDNALNHLLTSKYDLSISLSTYVRGEDVVGSSLNEEGDLREIDSESSEEKY